ncbi:hypothetical protein PAHAL_8G079100 [Panicum hallii]|uniref:NAC domain-containing protein n=1 Tax=Panicum hallii TaxID=206008 RepID=A0A2S3IE57_9POAL|nr:NAC domain-containing protein 21/22-like [Panicum hallii]PAN41920.1 hypothetical protein PAHAL_8G079100 [Panicum hallii]
MSMSFVSMVEAELPPGFRFHPRDDELIRDYLAPKVCGRAGFSGHRPPMVDVDLNKIEPWDLPRTALVGPREWYFFSLRDRKYATGQRTNRATASGYWKATGKDRAVEHQGMLVGMRKTLVFYKGRAPKGRKTEWVMHEYRVEGSHDQSSNFSKEDWVLCKVICKKKSGGGGSKSRSLATDVLGATSTTASSPPPATLMGITLAQVQAAMDTTSAGARVATLDQVYCFTSFKNCGRNKNVMDAAQRCYLPDGVTGNNAKGLPELGSCIDPTDRDKDLLKALLSDLGDEVVPSLPPEKAASFSSTLMMN